MKRSSKKLADAEKSRTAMNQKVQDKMRENWITRNDLESGIFKRFGDIDIVFGYMFSTVYVPRNAGIGTDLGLSGMFFRIGYRKPGGAFTSPTAGFIPVNGTPQKIDLSSSDQAIVNIHSDGSADFLGGGKVTVTLKVGGGSIALPLTVVELPFNASYAQDEATSVAEVVRQLGLPNKKMGAGNEWRYKKYPGAVIRVTRFQGDSASGWVERIETRKEE